MPASDRKAWIDYVCNIPFGGKRRFCQQLEKELAGFELPELVARLKPASPTVEELLGGDPQKVADAGLCELDERAMLQLGSHILTRPRILLKLQRFFLEIGGPYWQELLQKEDVSMPPRVRKILEYVDVRIKQVIERAPEAKRQGPKLPPIEAPGPSCSDAAIPIALDGVPKSRGTPPVSIRKRAITWKAIPIAVFLLVLSGIMAWHVVQAKFREEDQRALAEENSLAWLEMNNAMFVSRCILNQEGAALLASNTVVMVSSPAATNFHSAAAFLSLGAADFKVALAHLQAYIDRNRQIPSRRIDVGIVYGQKGRILLAQGKLEEAESAFAQAIELFERCRQNCPKDRRWRRPLVESYQNLGGLLQKSHREDEALSAYLKGVSLGTEAGVQRDTAMECQLPLAVCYLCTGSILKRKGQLADAEAAFHAESRIMAELAERRRDKPEYRLLLVYGRIQHAEVLMQMERIEEAQQELDETINLIQFAMADSPKVPRYRTLLVSASELLARLRQQCQEGQLNYSGEKQR